ncbi:hypothetical protein AU14_18880 [Marinobacter similis]|uniref:Uncharacterized protein n=1 Tax=Marinobacter similis TaxID=1420916 RepID=W5YMI5_9GAMM|nr:hypothetical protein AU14_18880 [Marinobacter similis]
MFTRPALMKLQNGRLSALAMETNPLEMLAARPECGCFQIVGRAVDHHGGGLIPILMTVPLML